MRSNTIFSKSKKGRNKYEVGDAGVLQKKLSEIIPKDLIRDYKIGLPELSENEVVRHFTALSRKNYGVDDGIYPLGSCTMKYNPKINEEIAKNPSFTSLPTKNIEQKELREHILSAISALSPKQRDIFVLRHWEGLPIKEIAVLIGRSEGTVKTHLFHAQRKLWKHLSGYLST